MQRSLGGTGAAEGQSEGPQPTLAGAPVCLRALPPALAGSPHTEGGNQSRAGRKELRPGRETRGGQTDHGHSASCSCSAAAQVCSLSSFHAGQGSERQHTRSSPCPEHSCLGSSAQTQGSIHGPNGSPQTLPSASGALLAQREPLTNLLLCVVT